MLLLALKHFWVYITLFIISVMLVVLTAIWHSVKPSSTPPSTILSDSTQEIIPIDTPADTLETNTGLASDKPVPEHFPAPAKKLHQLLNDTDRLPTEEQSLRIKKQKLDQQLAAINEQLNAQGLSVPEQSLPTITGEPELHTRLQAIKAHIDKKNL